ncbi:MAG TPA: helix-turn-helix domain-containing protein, partial [Candidatus Dormibacteraeota bacterium]|nr:helix-turn-helix domain-containing protein [Candidatus Dormibacteraeota bacterium]
ASGHAAAGGEPPVVLGIGPEAGALADIGDAAVRARRALDAGRRLDPSSWVHDDRDVGLLAILDAHPAEAAAFRDLHLGPLLGDGRHRDLLVTLQAVVSTGGLTDAAARLGVHRHTVVYRLSRLRDILEVDLDDSLVRHRLWLALQLHRLAGAG